LPLAGGGVGGNGKRLGRKSEVGRLRCGLTVVGEED